MSDDILRKFEAFTRKTGITDSKLDTYLKFRDMDLKGEVPESHLASGSYWGQVFFFGDDNYFIFRDGDFYGSRDC